MEKLYEENPEDSVITADEIKHQSESSQNMDLDTSTKNQIEFDKKRNEKVFQKRQEFESYAVKEGIKKLYFFLEKIQAMEGSLPSIIVVPETSGRLLVYAIRPLLEKVYASQKQSLPNYRFALTWRHIDEYKYEYEIEELNAKLLLLYKKKDDLLRLHNKLKIKDKKSADIMSTQIHKMSLHIETVKDSIRKTKTLITKDYAGITDSRIAEIIKEEKSGPILIIDDVLASGETLLTMDKAIKKTAPERPIYYFTFLQNHYLGDPPSDPSNSESWNYILDHYTSGVSYDGNPNKDNEHSNSQRLSIDEEAWGDMIFYGFSYRQFDKSQIGVKKDRISDSLYTETDTSSDKSQMYALREKFSAWGRESILDLENLP